LGGSGWIRATWLSGFSGLETLVPCLGVVLDFHPLHFALDICNMPSPLFTGLPAMMQNLPNVKRSGAVLTFWWLGVPVASQRDQ
jgi:hypothetical protein